jgi:RecA/RadA recombinase
MSGFTRGLERFLSSLEEDALSTGSPKLDTLLGGLRPGQLYLVYGDPNPVEELLSHTLVQSLKPGGGAESPRAVYMLCGNYRVEKTLMDTEGLVRLLEASGLEPGDALRRIYVLCAFSADQQTRLIDEIEGLLEDVPEIRLVMVRDIAKLAADDPRSRSRAERTQELQKATLHLKQVCAKKNVPVVVSCRARKRRRGLPKPEGGEFLKHLANVILYLRRRKKDAPYAKAHLLKHPAQGSHTVEYSLKGDEEMGRSTPPFRVSFEETVAKLKKEFQAALMDRERREAFNALVETWSSELGAMGYAESLTLLDLMLLAAAVDNRSLITKLRGDFDDLRVEVRRLREAPEHWKGADER